MNAWLHARHSSWMAMDLMAKGLGQGAAAMGIVTQWAIRLQTSDFYGPPPQPPTPKPPMMEPPPPISD